MEMCTKQFGLLAAAVVVGGGTMLSAPGADAFVVANGLTWNGISANGLSQNGMHSNVAGSNGVTGTAIASQGFDFNNVSMRAVTWSTECSLPADRNTAVFCGLGTSPF